MNAEQYLYKAELLLKRKENEKVVDMRMSKHNMN